MLGTRKTSGLLAAQLAIIALSLIWLAGTQLVGGILLVPIRAATPLAGTINLARDHQAGLVAAGRLRGSIVVTGGNRALVLAALAHGLLPLPASSADCGKRANGASA